MGKFLKRLFATGSGVVVGAIIAGIINFGALERKAEDSVSVCQNTYIQMLKSGNYNYNDYKYNCAVILAGLQKDIDEIMDGTKKDLFPKGVKFDKVSRQGWERTLEAGHRSQKNNFISDFEKFINNLNQLARDDWGQFNGNAEQRKKSFEERLEFIKFQFTGALAKLNEINGIKYKNKTIIEQIQKDRKEMINKQTLTEAYRLFEWYRACIFLRIEVFRALNPEDAYNTNAKFQEIKQFIESLNFKLDYINNN